MLVRTCFFLLAFVGCAASDRPFGPESECGAFYPDKVAYRAGCTETVRMTYPEGNPDAGETTVFVYDDRGLLTNREHFFTGSGERISAVAQEWDAHGELMRVETETFGSSGSVTGTEFRRDERKMLLKTTDLNWNVTSEYDVSSEECTWSELRFYEDDEVWVTQTAEWWEERITLITQNGPANHVYEERTSYNEAKLPETVEQWLDGFRQGLQVYEYTEDQQIASVVDTVQIDAGFDPFDVVDTWTYDDEGREIEFVRIDEDSEVFRRTNRWNGPFVEQTEVREWGEERLYLHTYECPDE